MHISEAIRIIDETGHYAPFRLLFAKSDGTLREMIAMKRNKERIPGGKATAGSAFTYNLSAKYSLLVNEITGLNTKSVDTPMGKIEVVIDEPPRHVSQSRMRPKSVRIFSILEFNNQKTYAG